MYNGLTALIVNPDLNGDNGRRILVVILAEADLTANITASVHSCEGGAGRTTSPDPLVVELAQVLVQPQFLNMVEAAAAWARRHAHLDFSHIYPSPVSISLEGITEYGMACLHCCFCMSCPSPIDPASPKLQQAAFSWFAAALQMIKAGGWQGPWPAKILHRLLIDGLGVPLLIMIRRAEAELVRVLQPLLPWAERPRCLECALQAAEWMLSAASTGPELCDNFGSLLHICSGLVTALHNSGVVTGAWCGSSQCCHHSFDLFIAYKQIHLIICCV